MNRAGPFSPLLHVPKPSTDAAVRLVCFPYAGGGANVFRAWPGALPGVEVAAVRLPGRETRLSDPPHTRMEPLVAEVADAVAAYAGRPGGHPFALFGHSMGARVAFEVARRLRSLGGPQPGQLFVSGCRAPHLPGRAPTHHLPREEFVGWLRQLGGVPDAVLDEPELVELVLPMLRADFAAVETHRHAPAAPLAAPVRVFCGEADPQVSAAQAGAWREHTSASCLSTAVPGGHFFLEAQRAAVLAVVRADLARLTAARTQVTAYG